MKSIIKTLYQNSRNKEIKKLIFKIFDKNYYIRINIAVNQITPISILEKLSKDEDSDVRRYIANNPRTPVSILEKLSKDESYFVRASVAISTKTPIHILEKLNNDESWDVRYWVSKNLNWINRNKNS